MQRRIVFYNNGDQVHQNRVLFVNRKGLSTESPFLFKQREFIVGSGYQVS